MKDARLSISLTHWSVTKCAGFPRYPDQVIGPIDARMLTAPMKFARANRGTSGAHLNGGGARWSGSARLMHVRRVREQRADGAPPAGRRQWRLIDTTLPPGIAGCRMVSIKVARAISAASRSAS